MVSKRVKVCRLEYVCRDPASLTSQIQQRKAATSGSATASSKAKGKAKASVMDPQRRLKVSDLESSIPYAYELIAVSSACFERIDPALSEASNRGGIGELAFRALPPCVQVFRL